MWVGTAPTPAMPPESCRSLASQAAKRWSTPGEPRHGPRTDMTVCWWATGRQELRRPPCGGQVSCRLNNSSLTVNARRSTIRSASPDGAPARATMRHNVLIALHTSASPCCPWRRACGRCPCQRRGRGGTGPMRARWAPCGRSCSRSSRSTGYRARHRDALVVRGPAGAWAVHGVAQRARGAAVARPWRRLATPLPDDVGFTLITLFDGFVIITALDLGAPAWLVIATAVAGIAAGNLATRRVQVRLGAQPATS